MIVAPLTSTRSAPAGTVVLAIGPTAAILPSRTMMVAFSITLPRPSITRAPTNAVVWADAEPAANASAALITGTTTMARRLNRSFRPFWWPRLDMGEA